MSYYLTEEYRKKHQFCPKCGCTSISQKLAAGFDDKDENGARCRCGWTGIVHDLTATRIPNACNCDSCVQKVIDGEFEQ